MEVKKKYWKLRRDKKMNAVRKQENKEPKRFRVRWKIKYMKWIRKTKHTEN